MKAILATAALLSGAATVPADEPRLAGNASGPSTVIFPTISDNPVPGLEQMQVVGFQNPRRGIIRSTAIFSGDLLSLSARDYIRIRGRRVEFQTTLNPISCGCEPFVVGTGTARVRGRLITYRAQSADGSFAVDGRLRIKRGSIVRSESRTYEGETASLQSELIVIPNQ